MLGLFFEFINGIRGVFDGNRLSDHIAADRRLTIGEMLIEGSMGTLRLNGNGEIFTRRFGDNIEKKVSYKWIKKGFAGDSVFQCQKHLLDHFLKGEKLINSAEEYLDNLKAEDYIYKSNYKKRLLELV